MVAMTTAMYLNEVGTPKYPNANEETMMFRALRNGADIMEQVVITYARLVPYIVRRYAREDNPIFDDLIQDGNIGLLRAIESFDLERGTRFTTYAWYWIKQAVVRSLWKSNCIAIPAHLQQKLPEILKTRDRLLLSLERTPTSAEIALELNIPEECVFNTLRAFNMPKSLDMLISNNAEVTLAELLPDSDDYYLNDFIDKEMLTKALQMLPLREQTVIKLHFGLGIRQQSLEEISHILGVSRERIRQIETAALKKLRKIVQEPEFASLAIY
jgi:RNA polymerase primary sigma factor